MAVFDHIRHFDQDRVAGARPARTPPEPHHLLRLQRLDGNAAVSSLVVQRQEENLPTQSGGAGGGGGGGSQMLNLVSLGKRGTVNVTLQNGTVIDASAQIG